MDLTKYKFGFLLLLFFGCALIASAQSISDIDFASLEVDQLSDQQIQRIAQAIEQRGLSTDQAMQLAVAQGLPRSEALKLQQRLRYTQTQQGDSLEALNQTSRLRSNPLDSTNLWTQFPSTKNSFTGNSATTNQDSIPAQERKLRNKIFGFKLFAEKKVDFQPALNIPTPSNYELGTGDELIIDIWGAAQNTYRLEVSPDGMIYIENLGPINVNGLTIDEAATRLEKRLGSIYSGLNPSDASQQNTYMQLSLGQVRSINITVIGEAANPGTYTLPSLATVFNALYSAGGPTVNGSFREIEIIRGDTVIATFDLYDLLINGNRSGNIRLHSQDIIKINPYTARVEIQGQVKRPGIYEMEPSESLADLLKFAGGFTGNAYTGRIKVIGTTERARKIVDVKNGYFDTYNLHNGDSVTVGKILDRFKNMVEIRGAVFRAGKYQLTDTTTVYSLIQQADGLKNDAFMQRGIIYRENPNMTISTISFDVSEIINNPVKHDINLQRNDVVLIKSIFDLREDYTVKIMGPVRNPKTFQFFKGMTLEDLIFQAGGFRQSAAPYRIEVARRVRSLEEAKNDGGNQIANIYQFSVDEQLELDPEDANFVLHPFDNVYVRRLPNYSKQKNIKIIGEVKYPGTYALKKKNARISDLIKRAGGLTGEAYIRGATLFRQRKFLQQESQQQAANIEGMDATEQQAQLMSLQSSKIGIELKKVLNKPYTKHDLILEAGDSLFVPTLLQTVTVSGGVFYPTSVRFEKGQSYKEYITAAGGFTDLANKKRAYVIYANGEVDRVKSFLFFKNYPEVRPGATLVVPEKEPKPGLSPAERVGIYSAIVSTAALIVTTIVQITN